MRNLYLIATLVSVAIPLLAAPPPKPVVKVQYSPAKFVGKAVNCAVDFPAKNGLGPAFFHIWNNTCWSCPAGYSRTANPDVKAPTACTVGPQRRTSGAIRHGKATGLIHTDCPKGSGQFLHIGDGYCYSCPASYVRTAAGITSAGACLAISGPKFAAGVERGNAGCPGGSFQNGLIPQCYSCPAQYVRNISIGIDLTKLRDACVRVEVNLPELKIPIPGDIMDRAFARLDKYRKVIDVTTRKMPAHEAAFLKSGNLEAVRDPEVEAAAEQAGLNTMSVGVGVDGSSPYVIGGSGSVEVSHSLRRWSGFKKTATIAVTGAPPALAGAGGSLQFSFLTDDFDSFDGWSLIVNLGAGREGKPWGGGVSAAFGIELTPVLRFVFQGFTVSAGAGKALKPVQASAGVAFQFPI
ncbi:MAG: hypothetical protein ABI823_10665 [Bryobacteraceae bacterium]